MDQLGLTATKNISPNLFPRILGGCFGKMNLLEPRVVEGRGVVLYPATNQPIEPEPLGQPIHISTDFTPYLDLLDYYVNYHGVEQNFSFSHTNNQGWLELGSHWTSKRVQLNFRFDWFKLIKGPMYKLHIYYHFQIILH
jgi:hypothetical protein